MKRIINCMITFDASSMVYGWDNYPIHQFPGLWEWIEFKISTGEYKISKIAFAEINAKFPECGEWLNNVNIEILEPNNSIVKCALDIKNLLAIQNDNYGKGVGENDIFIIATASVNNCILVSNEAKQNNLPRNFADYKIPAVCDLFSTICAKYSIVACIDFLHCIKRENSIFR